MVEGTHGSSEPIKVSLEETLPGPGCNKGQRGEGLDCVQCLEREEAHEDGFMNSFGTGTSGSQESNEHSV
eukprot:1139886-Pelagomonas_calceolata.AAC.5